MLMVLLVLSVSLSGLVAFGSLKSLKHQANELAEVRLEATYRSGEILGGTRLVRLWQFQINGASVASELSSDLDELKAARSELDSHIQAVRKVADQHGVASEFAAFESSWADYESEGKRFEALMQSGQTAEARALLSGPMGVTMTERVVPALESMEKALFRELSADKDKANVGAGFATMLVACLGALSASIAGWVAWCIRTRVVLPIRDITLRMDALARNDMEVLRLGAEALSHCDLSHRVCTAGTPWPTKGNDEIAQLGQAYNTAIEALGAVAQGMNAGADRLADLLGRIEKAAAGANKKSLTVSQTATQTANLAQDVRANVEQVTSATEESARASQDIARGSQQLAATATSAAQSAEALVAAVKTVKQSASEQLEATQTAEITAKTGSAAVEDTISSMERIDQQVTASAEAVRELGAKQAQIGAIVETISAISAQTNLLALNAAIEAARAGEHGRGFAVVADEVRKLAERASAATGEISELIDSVRAGVDTAIQSMEQSASEVREGTAHSAEAKTALAEILASAEALRAAAASSSSLVEQMSVETASVQDLIASVAAVSQETAAGAQEVSASSEEVSATAEEMAKAVDAQVDEIGQVSLLADDLSDSSSDLQVLVSTFRLEEHDNLEARLEAAKTGHSLCVKKMRKMLDGREMFDDKKLGDHHKCALGLWYDQLGAAEFEHLPEFQAIEAPHVELHAKLPEVIRAYNAGKHAEAEQRFKELTAISERVIASLDTFGRAAGASRSGSNRRAA